MPRMQPMSTTHRGTHLHNIVTSGNSGPFDIITDRMLGLVEEMSGLPVTTPNGRPRMELRDQPFGHAMSAAADLALNAYNDHQRDSLLRLLRYGDVHTLKRVAAMLRDVANEIDS